MPNLLPSAARAVSGSAVLTNDFSAIIAAALLLTVSAAATEAGDTLDVYLQASIDGGTTYDDFAHFTQVLGNGGAKKYRATWNALMAPEAELAAPADASMAAGVLQGPVGAKWRIKWVIVDASTANASFTFAVDAAFVKGAGR